MSPVTHRVPRPPQQERVAARELSLRAHVKQRDLLLARARSPHPDLPAAPHSLPPRAGPPAGGGDADDSLNPFNAAPDACTLQAPAPSALGGVGSAPATLGARELGPAAAGRWEPNAALGPATPGRGEHSPAVRGGGDDSECRGGGERPGGGTWTAADSDCPSLSSACSEVPLPPPEELPAGWRCRHSRKWGRPFYYHAASGRSQWHPPSPVDVAAPLAPAPRDLAKESSTLC